MTDIEAPPRQEPSRSHPSAPRRRRWTPGTVSLLVVGIVMVLLGGGMLAGAGVLKAVDNHWRDGDYLTSETRQLTTTGHALAVEDIDLDGLSGNWLGRARVRVTSSDPDAAAFLGVARTDDAKAYLGSVQYSIVDEVDGKATRYVEHGGGAPSVDPADSDIWIAQASGPGTQSVRWTPSGGDWTVVVMNTDGSTGVEVTADVGATAPVLEGVIWALLIVGIAFVVAGAGITVLVIRRTNRASGR